MSNPARILDAALREVDAGRRAVLCVIVATRGSTPQGAGAMLAVAEDGRIAGTVGGGCVEADIRARALQMPPGDPGEMATFALDQDLGLDDGQICGGSLDVAIQVFKDSNQARALREAAEAVRAGRAAVVAVRVQTRDGVVEYRVRIEEPPRLVIAGGGHIGRVLADLMHPLGFHVTVVDDREEFANPERFPLPVNPVVGDIEDTLTRWPVDPNTYIVIVTRGHIHDERALSAVLDSPARYIGMIGSRRKIETIYEDLRRIGAAEERLEQVHSPIGLDIHAVTPEEIAVSIAAELVSVRRAEYRKVVEGPFPISGN